MQDETTHAIEARPLRLPPPSSLALPAHLLSLCASQGAAVGGGLLAQSLPLHLLPPASPLSAPLLGICRPLLRAGAPVPAARPVSARIGDRRGAVAVHGRAGLQGDVPTRQTAPQPQGPEKAERDRTFPMRKGGRMRTLSSRIQKWVNVRSIDDLGSGVVWCCAEVGSGAADLRRLYPGQDTGIYTPLSTYAYLPHISAHISIPNTYILSISRASI